MREYHIRDCKTCGHIHKEPVERWVVSAVREVRRVIRRGWRRQNGWADGTPYTSDERIKFGRPLEDLGKPVYKRLGH